MKKEKNYLASGKQMPNAKRQMQKGITLIALVITVIVLLILAGTAISIAINGNNIFEKSNTAVERANAKAEEQKTNITQVDATFNTWYDQYNQNPAPGGNTQDTTAPSAPTGITVTNVTGTKATVGATGGNDDSGTWSYKYSIDNGTTWTEAVVSSQSYTYTNLSMETAYTVIAKSVDGAGNESSPIATGENFTTTAVYDGNIGRYVHYNVNLGIGTDISSVDDDWVVFYEDTATGYTYLIAADYVPVNNTTLSAALSDAGLTSNSSSYQYAVYSSDLSGATTLDSLARTRYKLSWNGTINKLKHNATVALLNTTAWSGFALSSVNSNITAVGGPTVDLWVASWNQRGYTPLYLATNVADEGTEGTNAYNYGSGYFVGTAETQTTTYQSVSGLAKTGYSSSDASVNNPVYFPRTSATADNCFGYWLASPSAYTYADNVMLVYYNGSVRFNSFGSTYYGVRPVVSMPTSIIGTGENPAIYYVD